MGVQYSTVPEDERRGGMIAQGCQTPRFHPERSPAQSKALVRQLGILLTEPSSLES